MAIIPDMDLSEFITLSKAIPVPGFDEYIVEITLADKSKSNLTVANCYSEFDAKERAYLYLIDKIHNHEPNKDIPG